MMYVFFVLYILCSASALLLIKAGGVQSSFALHSGGTFSLTLNVRLLLGLLLYIVSFCIFLFLMPKYNLALLYPAANSLMYVVLAVGGYFLLGEKLSPTTIVGLGFVLVGVFVMNLKR